MSHWIIKILATALGETGGGIVSMTWLGETSKTADTAVNGDLVGTAIFGVMLVALVSAQIRARIFKPWFYWATIIASTTCGTTPADFATTPRMTGRLTHRQYDTSSPASPIPR